MDTQIASLRTEPVYFDYQASTPLDRRVFDAMLPFYEAQFGNPHSAEHLHGQLALGAIEGARNDIAKCINAEADDLIFTSGASEANNLAILGTARGHSGRRSKMLVSTIEHSSVLEAASASGLETIFIPVDRHGQVDIGRLTSALTEEVLLVSVGFVNNEIGTIQDIAQISRLVQESGAYFHVDAAQALTSCPVDVADHPIDFLSLSSHKAYGPKGVGALYVAPGRRSELRPIVFGGGQEHGLRAGTLPTPLCVGFGRACSILSSSGFSERVSVAARRDYLLGQICSLIPDAKLVGSEIYRHPGNLSMRFPIRDARDLVQHVRPKLSCSTGSACHSGSEEPSHVLTNIGMSLSEARGVIRLSLGRFTSELECDIAARALGESIAELNSTASVATA